MYFPSQIGISPSELVSLKPLDMKALVEAFRYATGHNILRAGVNIAAVWDTFVTMKKTHEARAKRAEARQRPE